MNPFDLGGPEFLAFYLTLGVALLIVLFLLRRYGEPDPLTPVQLTDPYEIAYVRGGANEVMRLATVGLIDRGLLTVNGSKLGVADEARARLVTHPIERGILSHFGGELEAASVFSNVFLKAACDQYALRLTHLGLLQDDNAKKRRLAACAAVLGVLWLVSIVKIQLAMERGRRNIGFLIILTILLSLAAVAITNRVKRTRRGDRFLSHMRSLFDALRERSSSFIPRANTIELMLLGAVFGLSALPNAAFPYTRTLYPKAAADSSSGCGSSCGSSCGGGGCGGGCGGCGS